MLKNVLNSKYKMIIISQFALLILSILEIFILENLKLLSMKFLLVEMIIVSFIIVILFSISMIKKYKLRFILIVSFISWIFSLLMILTIYFNKNEILSNYIFPGFFKIILYENIGDNIHILNSKILYFPNFVISILTLIITCTSFRKDDDRYVVKFILQYKKWIFCVIIVFLFLTIFYFLNLSNRHINNEQEIAILCILLMFIFLKK